jgi:hypothetical protein
MYKAANSLSGRPAPQHRACEIKQRDGTGLPDGVSGPQANPLRDGSILLLCFCKLNLCAK